MAQQLIQEKVTLPEGTVAEYGNGVLTIKKESKEITKRFDHPKITLKVEGNTITIAGENEKRKAKCMVNTYLAHIENMVKGVTEGFTYKMKICAGHFPMTVKVEGDKVAVSNFLGEKIPRVAKIVKEAEVKIEKDVITVSSADKEAAGQTAANIERSTFIKGRDRRLFQDGIYITEKPHVKFI